MKHKDVVKPVMEKVIRFEKKRSSSWVKRYIGALVLLGIVIFYMLIRTFLEYREIDEEFMVLWYFEDWELFQRVWKDALEFIWTIVPRFWLFASILGFCSMIGMILATRKKRHMVKKRLQSMRTIVKEDI